MKVEINCTGSDTIQLHELTEFQGELKERDAGDISNMDYPHFLELYRLPEMFE